jgi:lipoate-protein ligase B
MLDFFSSINLATFDLNDSNIHELDAKTILVKKWNWDYSLAHQFQRKTIELLNLSPQVRVVICCSHPRVFTHGRGLQKPKKGETLELVDFNPSLKETLPFPFYQIERGGGLTFHHPGQMIIYPILRLNPKTLSLSKMIDTLFEVAIDVLKDWGLHGLDHENKLLGLWYGDKKLASMGVAIEKLTTFHGMALNFYQDEVMKTELMKLNPCGLDARIYTSVEELMNIETKTLEDFSELYLRRLSHAWK